MCEVLLLHNNNATRRQQHLPNPAHRCTSVQTVLLQCFAFHFWMWTDVFYVEKFQTPSGKLRNTVKLKTRIFQLCRDKVLTAQQQFVAITKDFWDLLRHPRHETPPPKKDNIFYCYCFTVASIDVRICYLYFHECIHFQHGWAEQWECDQLSDVTVLYMSSEALSWAVEVAAVLQSLRHHHRLIRINILTGCLW